MDFFPMLLYGYTTWMLTKHIEKNLDWNYTRILWAVLNKFWKQHPQNHSCTAIYHPSQKNIQLMQTRYVGHCWKSKGKLISDILWTPTHGHASVDQPVWIQDVVSKTCQEWWMIETDGDWETRKSMGSVQLDDIYIYI